MSYTSLGPDPDLMKPGIASQVSSPPANSTTTAGVLVRTTVAGKLAV
jgi:hypothetical protein